jgi:hypothetical protein
MNEVYFILLGIKIPKKKPRGQGPPAIKNE